MKNKVLVEIEVPEIDENYSVYLPANKKMGNIIILLNKAINDAKDRFDSQYKAGFVDAFDLSYVDYDCPLAFVQGNEWQYVATKFPTKGTVVFSFRRNKVWRRGFMEERFQSELLKKLGKYKLKIVGVDT